MLKKTVFIFAFLSLAFMGGQANAAAKSCKMFYEKHQLISAHLKEDVAKHHEKLAKESSEKQEKHKEEMKKLDDMMASLDVHMSKMDGKVNPTATNKKVKHSLSHCKKERKEISEHVTKIEKMLSKLDKEIADENHKVIKESAPAIKTHESKEASKEEAPKEGIWDRVKKLFGK